MAARQRRDDAARRRLADAERVADGKHEVADLKRVGIADRHDRERLGRVDLQDRQIERLVLEQDLAGEFAAVRHRDLHLVGAANDVEIRHHQAARIDHNARTQRILRARPHLPAEELLEEGIALEGRTGLARLLGRVDVDDGRRRLLHQRREGELDLLAAEGNAAIRSRGRAGAFRSAQAGRSARRSTPRPLARRPSWRSSRRLRAATRQA